LLNGNSLKLNCKNQVLIPLKEQQNKPTKQYWRTQRQKRDKKGNKQIKTPRKINQPAHQSKKKN